MRCAKIYNKSRKTLISKDCRICRTELSKALGLMFRLKPKTLVFVFEKEKIVPLHMLFVFFPIDVLYLDESRKVVDVKERFKPFTFHKSPKQSSYVIELPAGTISRTRTSVGDSIRF